MRRDFALPATLKIGVQYDKEGEPLPTVSNNAESGVCGCIFMYMRDRRARTLKTKKYTWVYFFVFGILVLACPAVKSLVEYMKN